MDAVGHQSPDDAPGRARPAWARWVTGVSLVVAVIALVFTIHKTGLTTLGTYFRKIGWWWIGVVVLEIVVTTLDAVAIRSFLSPEHKRVTLRTALLAQLAGRAVNAVTPTGNLGEAVKVSVLVDHVSQSRAVACILLYNVVGFTVELGVVAIAAPFLVMFVPMPDDVRWLMALSGVICLVLSAGLYFLVRRGMLTSVARLARRIRVLSAARYGKWEERLLAVDDKMRMTSQVRAADRMIGVSAMVLSRVTSMSISLMLLHAVGEPITVGFVAAFTVGGFAIYLVSSLVPMGVGLSEGGNYWLFRALHEDPARVVTVVLARRVTLLAYAAIGLVLVTASETVRRARDRQRAPALATATPATDVK